jgi:mannose-6-phosphate isomerase-like protein (cupin superfamily)
MEKPKNFSATEIGPLRDVTRVTLKEILLLTGAEVSVNNLPAGKASPFAHAHKRNEEIYLFTSGKGIFWLDGEKLPVGEGSVVRIAPAGIRALKADDSAPLSYICVQVDEGSLKQATREDGIRFEITPEW